MKKDKIKEEVLKELEKGYMFWNLEEINRRAESLEDIPKKEWINRFGFHKAIDLTIKKCQKQKRKQVKKLKERVYLFCISQERATNKEYVNFMEESINKEIDEAFEDVR